MDKHVFFSTHGTRQNNSMAGDGGVRERDGSWRKKLFVSTCYSLVSSVLGVEVHPGTGIAWVNDALGEIASLLGFNS